MRSSLRITEKMKAATKLMLASGTTTHAAELMGTADRGRIAPELLADVIAVEGNPLEDVTTLENVLFVMKGGVVYKQPGE